MNFEGLKIWIYSFEKMINPVIAGIMNKKNIAVSNCNAETSPIIIIELFAILK